MSLPPSIDLDNLEGMEFDNLITKVNSLSTIITFMELNRKKFNEKLGKVELLLKSILTKEDIKLFNDKDMEDSKI